MPGLARWLTVPAVIAVFALVGMAISTESRNDFSDRTSDPSEADGSPEEGDVTSGSPSSGTDFEPGEPVELKPGEFQPAEREGEASGTSGQGSESGQEDALVWYPMNVDVGSDNGDVGVLLGDDQNILTPRNTDGYVGDLIEIRPDATSPGEPGGGDQPGGDSTGTGTNGTGTGTNGTGTGNSGAIPGTATGSEVRLNGDGQLEAVGAGEAIEAGEVVLRPVEGGVDLVLDDGTQVELRPRVDSEGVTRFEATEVSPDGNSQVLSPDEDGVIGLGDGITISDPPATGILPRPAPSLLEQATSAPWLWIFLGIAALAVVSAVVAIYLHRRRPTEPFGPDFVGLAGVPANRFEEFLAMLLADPDPNRAIRLAFFAAERGIGGLPPRQKTETPFEWCQRVVDQRPDVSQPLASLCNRFATVRFAPERPTSADRDAAVAELRELFEIGSSSRSVDLTGADGVVGVAAGSPS